VASIFVNTFWNFNKNQTEFDSVDIDKKLVFTLNKYYKKLLLFTHLLLNIAKSDNINK
jgi:hypothetical protein